MPLMLQQATQEYLWSQHFPVFTPQLLVVVPLGHKGAGEGEGGKGLGEGLVVGAGVGLGEGFRSGLGLGVRDGHVPQLACMQQNMRSQDSMTGSAVGCQIQCARYLNSPQEAKWEPECIRWRTETFATHTIYGPLIDHLANHKWMCPCLPGRTAH